MATGVEAAADDAGGRSYGAPAYRGFVLLLLMIVYTLNFIDRNLLSVIAQPVINAFDLSDSEYGFLNGPPFAIFYAVMGIPIAMAADRYNRVVIISLCIALWSVMAALCGLATSFLFLLIARIGVAIGEAGCTPPANSLIGDYFKPSSRANALAIYATGVTIGGALANAFGGPIATQLNGANVEAWLVANNLSALFPITDWSNIEGWRIAFVVIGAPGVLIALAMLAFVKEPPRGYSDPPHMAREANAGIMETLRELARKPTFWTMAMGAALTALVGYGLAGFQAPMAQRVHGIGPGDFALQFGVPLALFAAVGTFLGGYLTERLTPRSPTAVCWIPALGLFLSIPFYLMAYFTPTAQIDLAWGLWSAAALLHFTYLGSQYTIGQGVVSTRSRASAIAVLLLIIALIGNGLGPQIVGWLSDTFMNMELANRGAAGVLTNEMCRAKAIVATLPEAQQAICAAAYGEGLRQAMAATVLFFIPASAFFWLSSLTYNRDLVARH